MILLVVTVCLGAGADAECRREVRLFREASECRTVGRAYVAFIEASQPAPLFVGAKCVAGVDA